MAHGSPLRYGVRRAAGDSALVLAEIGWRWAFGVAAIATVSYGVGRLLATTHLSEANLLALRSRTPLLIADAVTHIIRDAWPRLATAAAITLPSLAVLWTFAAGLGRAATLKALLEKQHALLRPMLELSFLRAALALAGVLAMLAALIVAGLAAVRGETNSPGIFLLVFLSLGLLVSLSWSVLNWYLSLAPVFALREGCSSLSSIAEAARAVRRNRGAFSSVSVVFGFVRLFAMAMAAVLGLLPLALVGTVAKEIVLGLMGLVALGYFAFADFLYIARLAAYVRIVEDSEPAPASGVPQPAGALESPPVVASEPEGAAGD